MKEYNQIIIEFILRTEALAYENKFNVCKFCSFPKEYYGTFWKGTHSEDCIYSRAERLVLEKCEKSENLPEKNFRSGS